MNVCPVPGCPTLVPPGAYRGLCDQHRAERDQQRGTPTQRGYGPAHQALRAAWQTRIDNGETVRCVTCGVHLRERAWHLGHDDDRTTWIGPQCVACNLQQAGRASHRQG